MGYILIYLLLHILMGLVLGGSFSLLYYHRIRPSYRGFVFLGAIFLVLGIAAIIGELKLSSPVRNFSWLALLLLVPAWIAGVLAFRKR